MSHVHLVAVIVRDYDEAIRFFVDVLEFKLVEDVPSATTDGRPKRWAVVRPLCARRSPTTSSASVSPSRSRDRQTMSITPA